MARRKFSKAQTNYMKALAAYQTICEIEKECKIKVLAENEFYSEPVEGNENRGPLESERILDPIADYQMPEQDFTEYCKLVYVEYQAKGVAPKDYNTSIDWPYRKALMDAENDLIDWGLNVLRTKPEWKIYGPQIEELRDKLDHHLKIKKQVIELTMKLVA